MSFTYKNLLIVTRGSNNIDTVNLTKDQYHIWFNQHPLKYQSNQDKIVIFYELPQPNGSDGLVELGETTRFTPTGTPQGIIKLLCDGLSIKITECIFNSADDFEKYLLTFRDYLIATIKAAGITDLVTNKVTLFWKKKTLNSVVRSISKECGLLTNESNKSHTFVATEINCSKDSKQILQTTRLFSRRQDLTRVHINNSNLALPLVLNKSNLALPLALNNSNRVPPLVLSNNSLEPPLVLNIRVLLLVLDNSNRVLLLVLNNSLEPPLVLNNRVLLLVLNNSLEPPLVLNNRVLLLVLNNSLEPPLVLNNRVLLLVLNNSNMVLPLVLFLVQNSQGLPLILLSEETKRVIDVKYVFG
jgi:hypothetical protein